jgi:hypothetical protein
VISVPAPTVLGEAGPVGQQIGGYPLGSPASLGAPQSMQSPLAGVNASMRQAGGYSLNAPIPIEWQTGGLLQALGLLYNRFDIVGNRSYTVSATSTSTRGGQLYYPPYGWQRYGLKVQGVCGCGRPMPQGSGLCPTTALP